MEVVRQLSSDKLSGAAEITQKAAVALAALDGSQLQEAIETLLGGHPSMAPLWRLANEVLSHPSHPIAARAFLRSLRSDRLAADALPPLLGEQVLTISYSSTVKAAIERLRPMRTLCMRSDPGGEGSRMAAAISEWTRASVMPDDEAIERMPAAAVIVGADAVTPRAVVNKVKTRRLAASAREKGVSCYSVAVAGATKFVAEDLPLGEAFEAVPLGLFTGIATPMGLLSHDLARAHAQRAQLRLYLCSLVARWLG